ncbi:MAG: hypothetical protein CMG03_01820 [Candidatus Marinimicrobia bacterium]|nr:hypothetical protein [Candidatus Neomarinimicrobiota bacterium]|tara:strand:- start:994 stop:1947 length:954 start_codon:yes stop_codon:yes gene_type:complete
MIRIVHLSLIFLFLFSCNNNDSSKVELSKDIDFNILVNDYKLINSDSLQVKLNYQNPGLSNIVMSWSTNDIINGKFDFGSDSLNADVRNIPVSIDTDSVFIDLKQDGISIHSFSVKVQPRNQQKVIILNDNESSFSSLIDGNRLFQYDLVRTESFKKYDFSGYDILIVEDVKDFSDNLIREIQKFMLSQKTILYFMENVDTEYLSKTLDYPKIKALRGTSKNQFFKFNEEYPNKYLSKNSKEFQIFRFYELKDYKTDEAYFSISTSDPLVIKKNILGSKVVFLATKIDEEWTNKLFKEFVYDLFIELVHNQIVVNES